MDETTFEVREKENCGNSLCTGETFFGRERNQSLSVEIMRQWGSCLGRNIFGWKIL